MTNTTTVFLKENREEIINVLNNIISNMRGVTLKEAMVTFKNEMEKTNNNKTLSYFAVKELPQTQTKIEVVYSKPYSQSNHAKMVNYHGKEKARQLTSL